LSGISFFGDNGDSRRIAVNPLIHGSNSILCISYSFHFESNSRGNGSNSCFAKGNSGQRKGNSRGTKTLSFSNKTKSFCTTHPAASRRFAGMTFNPLHHEGLRQLRG
jgi:hypothetical protein